MLKKLGVLILILSITANIILTISIIFLVVRGRDTNLNNNGDNSTQIDDEFQFNKEYLGNNTWEYSIKGTLPNPCTKATVDSFVKESYPEQVAIQLKLEQTSGMCIMMTKDFSYKGRVNASQYATFDFNVTR